MSRYLLGVALAQVEPPRPRRRRRALLAVPVAIGLGALALAGAADARTAKFRVSIEGKQRVTWKEHKVDAGHCPSVRDGSGSETLRFRSRPVVLTATGYGSYVSWRRGRGPARLSARGAVTRRGSSTFTPMFPPSAKECYGSACTEENLCDPTSWKPPPAPDCGTHRFSHYPLELRAWPKGHVMVEDGHPSPLAFANCTYRGIGFPDLLSSQFGRTIAAKFPNDEIFDASLGKHLVIGRGSVPIRAGRGVTGRAKVRWTLELVRLRRR